MGLVLVSVHSSTFPAATVVSVLASLNSLPLMVKRVMPAPPPMPMPAAKTIYRRAATEADRRSPSPFWAGTAYAAATSSPTAASTMQPASSQRRRTPALLSGVVFRCGRAP
ncbi:MAG TPA: hypothetical protein VF885_07320 [Arthrobacter sp.]